MRQYYFCTIKKALLFHVPSLIGHWNRVVLYYPLQIVNMTRTYNCHIHTFRVGTFYHHFTTGEYVLYMAHIHASMDDAKFHRNYRCEKFVYIQLLVHELCIHGRILPFWHIKLPNVDCYVCESMEDFRWAYHYFAKRDSVLWKPKISFLSFDLSQTAWYYRCECFTISARKHINVFQ